MREAEEENARRDEASEKHYEKKWKSHE